MQPAHQRRGHGGDDPRRQHREDDHLREGEQPHDAHQEYGDTDQQPGPKTDIPQPLRDGEGLAQVAPSIALESSVWRVRSSPCCSRRSRVIPDHATAFGGHASSVTRPLMYKPHEWRVPGHGSRAEVLGLAQA